MSNPKKKLFGLNFSTLFFMLLFLFNLQVKLFSFKSVDTKKSENITSYNKDVNQISENEKDEKTSEDVPEENPDEDSYPDADEDKPVEDESE